MSEQIEADKIENRQLWHNLYEAEKNFLKARQEFIKQSIHKKEILTKALNKPEERRTALSLLKDCFKSELKKEYIKDLLIQARIAHADLELCWEVILSLPKDFVKQKIEEMEEFLLPSEDESEKYVVYRSLLALYIQIDYDLAYQLALRAKENPDEDVKETGEDYLELLNET